MTDASAKPYPYEPQDVLMYINPFSLTFGGSIFLGRPFYDNGILTSERKSIFSKSLGRPFLGSVKNEIGDDLYVATDITDSREIDDFLSAGADHCLNVVSRKFKEVIEIFSPEKSEFFPLKIIQKPKRGGWKNIDSAPEICDEYWIWNIYNWIDIIDEEKSVWEKYKGDDTWYKEKIREDISGCPIQRFKYFGPPGYVEGRKLILSNIDYDRHPFFHLVGLPKTVFISPAVAGALRDAGLLRPRGSMRIGDMWLDTTIVYAPPPDGGRINVPLRISGTDIVLPNSLSESWLAAPFPPIR